MRCFIRVLSGVVEWRDDYQPPAPASDSPVAGSSSVRDHGRVGSAPGPAKDVCRKRTSGGDVNSVASFDVDALLITDVRSIAGRLSDGTSGNVLDVCERTRRSIGVQVHASQDIGRPRLSGGWRHAIQVGVQVGDSLRDNLGSSKRKSDSGLHDAQVGWQRTTKPRSCLLPSLS